MAAVRTSSRATGRPDRRVRWHATPVSSSSGPAATAACPAHPRLRRPECPPPRAGSVLVVRESRNGAGAEVLAPVGAASRDA
jgi:hypothetical protein